MKKAFFSWMMVPLLALVACAPAISTPSQMATETNTPQSAPILPTREPSLVSPTSLPVLPLPVRDELTFKLVTQMGGTLNALAVDGNIVYLGIGPRLVIVDFTDPAAPRILWQSNVLPGVIGAIALQAGLAYVSAGLEIEIYDTSDPFHPLLISSVSRLAESFYGLGEIFPAGAIVYAIGFGSLDYSTKSLMTFDVSDPRQPTLIRTRELSINAGVMVRGEVLYIADQGKLQLFDTANLDQTFSEIELASTESYSIAIISNVAYVLAHNQLSPSDSLVVVDVSDPRQPHEIATLKFDIEHNIRDVAATDQALFLLGHSWPHTKCPTFLYIIDITDPASPGDPTKFDPQSCLERFALVDEALAATSDSGLQIYNVSDPANIVLVSELAPPDGFRSVEKVALNPGLAYLLAAEEVASFTWALRVLDVTSLPPRLLNGDGLDFGSVLEPMSEGLYVRGDRLFGIEPRAVDISEPASPRLVTDDLEGVFYWPIPVLVEDVLFTGLLTKTSGGPIIGGGLGIVDMSNPANPVLADTVPMESFMVVGMSVVDRHLIVFSHKFENPQEGSWLQIYDVRNPFKPIEVGGLHLPVVTNIASPIITTVGDTIYLSNRYDDHAILYTVDISNPTQPMEVGRFALPNNAGKMVVVGEIIYMSLDGVWALNVSDRSHPYLAGHVPFPPVSSLGDFDIVSDLLYLAAGDAGLYILQVEK